MIPIGRTPPDRGGPDRGAADTAGVTEQRWVAEVGEDNAQWFATESRTARLAREYRPIDLGDGRLALSAKG